MLTDQGCPERVWSQIKTQWLVADSYLHSSQLTVCPLWKEDPHGVTSLPLDFLSYLTHQIPVFLLLLLLLSLLLLKQFDFSSFLLLVTKQPKIMCLTIITAPLPNSTVIIYLPIEILKVSG